ncbi:MAG: cystathionine gamma-synthase family protein [Thermoanaerobaculia bacterium]
MARDESAHDKLPGLHPESLMMSHGYHPEWSEGAIKPPLFLTSTFAFPSAQAGKAYFEDAYGLAPDDRPRAHGLIYSRLNNPDLEILEGRLNLWDQAEAAAVFSSGMAAISTSILALVPLGRSVLFSRPVYGGTDYLLETILPEHGVITREFAAGSAPTAVEALATSLAEEGAPVALVLLETPANPTMTMTDIAGVAEVAHRHGALLAVDNTFLGPLYQQPLLHGADLVLYSATKYLGGHSDLLAGAALGSRELVDRIKLYRTILGSMLEPFSAWLLLRSLETAKLRMTCARKNAERIAAWLSEHPRIASVHFPGRSGSPEQRAIYRRQCSGPGAVVAFELADAGEAEAFRFLDSVRLVKLAVSLGGTESLIEHPATMTHSDVPVEAREALGITPALVRLSVGVENPDDLIRDLEQALARLEVAAAAPTAVR